VGWGWGVEFDIILLTDLWMNDSMTY
jgi:hypothetical protein